MEEGRGGEGAGTVLPESFSGDGTVRSGMDRAERETEGQCHTKSPDLGGCCRNTEV